MAGALATSVTTALAAHSVRFAQPEVTADREVTLDLQVPEAGQGHNPEGTRDHHTTQVRVSVPTAFAALGCIPPDGWDCARTGELFRFFQEDDLTLTRPDALVLGLYLQTPDENGSWGFRTVQVYNDGHETRFTVEGGTAPTVTVTGAAPPPGPSPSPTTTPASPAPSATPTPTTRPSPSEEPAPSRDEPSQPPGSPEPGASPAVATATPPAGPTTASPSPTAAPVAPGPSASGEPPTDGVADAAATDPPDDLAGSDRVGGPDSTGGPDGPARAALSLVVVAGGWAVVEFRARRHRDAG